MEDKNSNQNEQVENNVAENKVVEITSTSNVQEQVENKTDEKGKKSKTNVILIVIIVILLCLINAGVGYYFGTKSNSDSNSSNSSEKNDKKTSDDKKDDKDKKDNKDQDEDKKEIFNDKGIKVLLDKNGEAFITYSEIDAENKSIVSNVKSYLLVKAGQSDVCEGNKRLLFVLNDGTISSLNIDALVCGKKLDVKNKIANLNNVVGIRDSLEQSGTNEPENHVIYAQTSDSKQYIITKVLTGESSTAELYKEKEENKEDKKDTVKAYKSSVNVSSIISQMGYNKMNVVPIYSSSNDYVIPGEIVKNGDNTLYISCSFELTNIKSNCNEEEKYYGNIIVYSIDGYYIMEKTQTGGGGLQIFDNNLKKIMSTDLSDSVINFAIVNGGIIYQNGECEGTRSDGKIGNVNVVHFYNFKTRTDTVLFNVDHDAGWVC